MFRKYDHLEIINQLLSDAENEMLKIGAELHEQIELVRILQLQIDRKMRKMLPIVDKKKKI